MIILRFNLEKYFLVNLFRDSGIRLKIYIFKIFVTILTLFNKKYFKNGDYKVVDGVMHTVNTALI